MSFFATVPIDDLAWVLMVRAVFFAFFFASAGAIGQSDCGRILRLSFLVTSLSFLLLLFLLEAIEFSAALLHFDPY